MKIYDCAQLSDEWWALRCGKATCSDFGRILTGGGKLSAQADAYAEEIAASILAPDPDEPPPFANYAMTRGSRLEHEARAWYEMEYRCCVQRVGFISTDDGWAGGSPDGLVGEIGGAEIKCPLAKTHIAYWRRGELPTEHKPQVHGYLWLTERLWWDFVSYCPGLPPFRVRIEPDEYTEQLGKALEQFRCDLETLVAKIRAESA